MNSRLAVLKRPFWLIAIGIVLLVNIGAGNRTGDFTSNEELEGASIRQASGYRQPSAVQLNADGKSALIACEASGNITIVDLDQNRVAFEWKLGKSIRDLKRIDANQFIATDFESHQLLKFSVDAQDKKARIHSTLDTVGYPTAVIAEEHGTLVLGLWSHQAQLIVDENEANHHVFDLPFAPGEATWIPSRKAYVISAKFTNQLILLHQQSDQVWKLSKPLSIEGFSIRGVGLAFDQQSLWLSGQTLNKLARSTRNDVHWGLMVSNELKQVDVESLFSKKPEMKITRTIAIGKDEDGKADPGAIRIMKDGSLMVALEGVGQVAHIQPAVGKRARTEISYRDVGERPVAIAESRSGGQAVIANAHSASVSVFDPKSKETGELKIGKLNQLTNVQKGQRLFFDAKLSHDSWISCNSCHVDGHTNGLLNDNLSDQSYGAPKLVITTMGRDQTSPFAWNGSAKSLQAQVANSIEKTMQSDIAVDQEQVERLVDYLKSLEAAPSVYLARQNAKIGKVDAELASKIENGKKLFASLNCRQCHQGNALTSDGIKDVDLKDELGNTEFNPPSLLGVSQRPRLFHDGRAETIEQLVNVYRHQLPRKLDPSESEDLIHFLKSI